MELNYFVANAQFFQFQFRVYRQVAHKGRFMRHLRVFSVPKFGKTVHLLQSNSTPTRSALRGFWWYGISVFGLFGQLGQYGLEKMFWGNYEQPLRMFFFMFSCKAVLSVRNIWCNINQRDALVQWSIITLALLHEFVYEFRGDYTYIILDRTAVFSWAKMIF